MPTALDPAVALVSLAEAKEYLKVTNSNDDVILSHLINAVSAWVAGYLKRNLVATSYVEYYSGDGSFEMMLRNYPINSISAINIDALRVFASDNAVDVTANVIIKKGQGLIRAFNLLYGWTSGESNIKISYNAGYTAATDGGATGTMPYDIRMAAKRILERSYIRGYTQRKLDYQSESLNSMNVTFNDSDVPKDVKSMLDGWKAVVPATQYEYAD